MSTDTKIIMTDPTLQIWKEKRTKLLNQAGDEGYTLLTTTVVNYPSGDDIRMIDTLQKNL